MNASDSSPAKKHEGLYTTLENRPIGLLSLDDEEFQLWQELRSSAEQILANIDETKKQLEVTLAEKGKAVPPWSQFENLWNEQLHALYRQRGCSSEEEVHSLLYQLHSDLSARIGIALGHARLGVTCADELECVHLDYEDGWEFLAQVTGVDRRRLLAIACGAHCTFGEFRKIAQKLQLRPVCVPLLSEADVRSVPADIAPAVEKPLEEVLSIADAVPLEDVDRQLHERGLRLAFRTTEDVRISEIAKLLGATVVGTAPHEKKDPSVDADELFKWHAEREKRRRARYPR